MSSKAKKSRRTKTESALSNKKKGAKSGAKSSRPKSTKASVGKKGKFDKKGAAANQKGSKKGSKNKKSKGKKSDDAEDSGAAPPPPEPELPPEPPKEDPWLQYDSTANQEPGPEDANKSRNLVHCEEDLLDTYRDRMKDFVEIALENKNEATKLKNLLCDPEAKLEDNILEDYTGLDDPQFEKDFGTLNADNYELDAFEMVKLFAEWAETIQTQFFDQYVGGEIASKPEVPDTRVHNIHETFINSIYATPIISYVDPAQQYAMPEESPLAGALPKLKDMKTPNVPMDALQQRRVGATNLALHLPDGVAPANLMPGSAAELATQALQGAIGALGDEDDEDDDDEDADLTVAIPPTKKLPALQDDQESGSVEEDDEDEDDDEDAVDEPDSPMTATDSALETPVGSESDYESDTSEDSDDDSSPVDDGRTLEADEIHRWRLKFRNDNEAPTGEPSLYRPVFWKRIFHHKHGEPMKYPDNIQKPTPIREYTEEAKGLDDALECEGLDPSTTLTMSDLVDPPEGKKSKKDKEFKDKVEVKRNLEGAQHCRYIYDFGDTAKLWHCPIAGDEEDSAASDDVAGRYYTYRVRVWVHLKDFDDNALNWHGSDDPKDFTLIYDRLILQNQPINQSKKVSHLHWSINYSKKFAAPFSEEYEGKYENPVDGDNQTFFTGIDHKTDFSDGFAKLNNEYVVGSDDPSTQHWYENGIVAIDAYVPGLFELTPCSTVDDMCTEEATLTEYGVNYVNRLEEAVGPNAECFAVLRSWSDNNPDEAEVPLHSDLVMKENDAFYNYTEKRKIHSLPSIPWIFCQSFYFNNFAPREMEIWKTTPAGDNCGMYVEFDDQWARLEDAINRSKRPDCWTIAIGYSMPLSLTGPSTLICKPNCFELKVVPTCHFSREPKEAPIFERETLDFNIMFKGKGKSATKIFSEQIRGPEHYEGEPESFNLKSGDVKGWVPCDVSNSHIVIISKSVTGHVTAFLDGRSVFNGNIQTERSSHALEKPFHYQLGYTLTSGDKGNPTNVFSGFIFGAQMINYDLDPFELNLLHRIYSWKRYRHIGHIHQWQKSRETELLTCFPY